ncbi:MAG: hypothetical protein AAF399_07260 [Bacteroidota bacterium]
MKFAHLLYAGLILLAISMFACQTSDLPPAPVKERTYLHVLNAYSGLPDGIDMRFTYFEKKQLAVDRLRFQQAWPPSGYASLLTEVGDSNQSEVVQVMVDVLDNPSKEEIFSSFPLDLTAGAKSTVCLIDSFGKPLLVKTIDTPKEYESQTANIRFMNLNSTLRSVSLIAKADTFRIPQLNFLNYSSYELIPAGTYTFYFVNDFTGNRVDSVKNVSLKSQQAYSFYLTQQNGFPVGAYEVLE